MDYSEWTVLAVGLSLIIFVLWYFFGERKRVTAAESAGGVQEIRITVKGGFEPDVIVVQQNSPVRLDFYRDETSSCSEEVMLGGFHIARRLPAFKSTSVEFTPTEPGEFTFTCGMNMLRGKIVVEGNRAP